MNILTRLVTSLFAFVLFVSLVSAQDVLRVDTDIIGDVVGISVPDSVYLGNVSRGFKTNDTTQITITNTGTTNIMITPELVSSNSVFSNLYMKRIQSDSFKKIGEFSLNISRPSTLGGTRQQTMYLQLDLSDYTGSLDSGVTRKSSDVRFIAVAV